MNDEVHPVPSISIPLEIVFAIVTSAGLEERRFKICGGAHFRVPLESEEVSLPLAADDELRLLPEFRRSEGFFRVWSVCTSYEEGHFWVELHFTKPE